MKKQLPTLMCMIKQFKQWSFEWAVVTGLDLDPKEYEFIIIPTIIISFPPDGMKEIVKPSFALTLHWGYWGYGMFCIKQKQNPQ